MSASSHALVTISASLSDPTGMSPLSAAVTWLESTLLGTIATTVAIIAVASVGIMMLAGRIDLRHGATVALGCFVLFGASSITAGIRYAAQNIASEPPPQAEVASAPIVIPPRRPNYDPYAGASVPPR